MSDLQPIASPLGHGAFTPDPDGGWDGYRLGGDDIVDLPRIVGKNMALRVELMPVIAILGRRPVGEFASLADLYRTLPGPPRKPSRRAVACLRDLFLNIVDRRLQRLYQQSLARDPPAPGARHMEKLASFESVRADALALVHSHDWAWLARWLDLDRIGGSAETCLRRLSNFAFDVGRVNFRFTYHCNIACRHCYNHSGPDQKAQRLNLEAMRQIVAQMPAAGIDAINLSGGEPFLYPDILGAMVAAGRAAGLREVSILSNGFWAMSEAKARRTLTRLADAGFMQGADDFLKVSSGVYHQEFIGFERILIASRVFHDLFGRRLLIDVELPNGEEHLAKDYRQRLADEGVDEMVSISFRSIALLGRATQIEGLEEGNQDKPCDAINQLVFDPDGSARPCCGLNNENQGVVIGALGRQDLRALVKSMQNDPILQFISQNPLNALRDHMESPPEKPPQGRHCTVCQALVGGLSDKEPLQARLFGRQKFYPFWFVPAQVA